MWEKWLHINLDRKVRDHVIGGPYAILRNCNLILHIVRKHERFSEDNEMKGELGTSVQICGQGVEPQPGEARGKLNKFRNRW